MPNLMPHGPMSKPSGRLKRDPTTWVIWTLAGVATAAAVVVKGTGIFAAGEGVVRPFLVVGVVVVVGYEALRLGWFRRLTRRLPLLDRRKATLAVLGLAAVVSGLINLDVAVVVAMPLAFIAAPDAGLDATALSLGVANVANAASFLLPTSNVTNLLVLGHPGIPAATYVSSTWIAWLLTVGGSLVVLTASAPRAARSLAPGTIDPSGSLARIVGDLLAMFLIATGVRALVEGGVTLPSGFGAQTIAGSALAAVTNNLPAAALVHPGAGAGPWAAILAMAAGPNLLITGSVATVICRRFAVEAGTSFPWWRWSVLGVALLPLQLALAYAGLRLTGAVGG